jgi:hypothetical protein
MTEPETITPEQTIKKSVMRNIYPPFLILLVVFTGCKTFESAIGYTGSPEETAVKRMAESEDKQTARAKLSANFQYSKKATDRLLILDANIENASDFAVKDFAVECRIYAESGTQLEVKKQTVFDVLQPKQSKAIKEISFGFVNSQMETYRCLIDDFTMDK